MLRHLTPYGWRTLVPAVAAVVWSEMDDRGCYAEGLAHLERRTHLEAAEVRQAVADLEGVGLIETEPSPGRATLLWARFPDPPAAAGTDTG